MVDRDREKQLMLIPDALSKQALTSGCHLDQPTSLHIGALYVLLYHFLAAAGLDKKIDKFPQCRQRDYPCPVANSCPQRPPPHCRRGQSPCPLAGSRPQGRDCQQWVGRKGRCGCGGAGGGRGGAGEGAGGAAVGSCLALDTTSYQCRLSYSCAPADRV